MNLNDHQNASDSPKTEIGEIDTRAPFQSVKDAVNLFGEGAHSGENHSVKKEKPQFAVRPLARGTQLHFAQKDIAKLKEQIYNAETIKTQAFSDLEGTRKSVEDLNSRLKIIMDSKETALKEAETAKTRMKQLEDVNSDIATMPYSAWKQNLEAEKEQCKSLITELDAAKQELRHFHQNCDASLDAKATVLQQAVEADHAMKDSMDRASELSQEISSAQESIRQAKLASLQVQQEQENIHAEKNAERETHKASLKELSKKLVSLKEEFDPELESQLAGKEAEIGVIQNELEQARVSDLDLVRSVAMELDAAKELLEKVGEDERLLRSLVESLKVELENLKMEHSELKEKEAETESIAGNLHMELCKCKAELEGCLAEETKARAATDELTSTLHQILQETENARLEVKEMKAKVEELRREAEAARVVLKEVEERLGGAMVEVEQAKAAEVHALDRSAACVSTSAKAGMESVTISKEELEALRRKVEEADGVAEMKVAAAMAQVEAVRAGENEAGKRMELARREVAELKAATEEALRQAEVAEAAKRAVEGELRKWREREERKAAEAEAAAAAALVVTEQPQVAPSQAPAEVQHRVQKGDRDSEKMVGMRKGERVSKKASLWSGIFGKKKGQVEGSFPSFLPGEKRV